MVDCIEDYEYELTLENEDEWIEHLKRVEEHSEGKTEEELMEEAYDFDFHWKMKIAV